MDDTQQSRVSDAAATRKRRSSILKSQRPPRTPFSDLEFNVATPTDTTKSRRVSFSRRTGVAEFITNEATTTWKNFYEEHNKSLESSGNESEANAPRQPVGHLGNRIFDQQFQGVEAVDLGGTLNPCQQNSLNFTQQLASLEESKLAPPQNKFELSALTDHQSKVFGNDFTALSIGEMSGRINVNFSVLQKIGDQDDLDEIQRDIQRVSSNVFCQGPARGRPSMSEYIEVDLNMTHIQNEESDMSITDTVHSPKVQDVSKSCSIDKKVKVDKDWVADKENIAVNPYIAPRESANFALNEESDKVLVFDGKRLTLQTDNDRNYRQTLVPNLTDTPQRKTIVLNVNDDLPNFTDDMHTFKTETSGITPITNLTRTDDLSYTAPVYVDSGPKVSLHVNTGDISLTQALPSNIIADNRKSVIYDGGNVSVTQALPAQILTNRQKTTFVDTDNISETQAVPTNILTHNDEGSRTVIYDGTGDMSVTQAVPNITNIRRKTVVYDNDDGNISVTQAVPVNILLAGKVQEKRRTIIFEDGNMSVTQALPTNLIPQKLEKHRKRQTIHYEEDNGNISVTQAVPNVILQEKKENQTIVYDSNISMTQALPNNVIITEKVRPTVYHNDRVNISVTQEVPTNVKQGFTTDGMSPLEVDVHMKQNNETIAFKQDTIYDDAYNISMTQAIPNGVILSEKGNEKRRTILFDQDDCDISMTQALPINILLDKLDSNESCGRRCGESPIFEGIGKDEPMNIDVPVNIDAKETSIKDTDLDDVKNIHMSVTEVIYTHNLNQDVEMERNHNDTGQLSVSKPIPADIILLDMIKPDVKQNISVQDNANQDIFVYQTATTHSALKLQQKRTDQGDSKSENPELASSSDVKSSCNVEDVKTKQSVVSLNKSVDPVEETKTTDRISFIKDVVLIEEIQSETSATQGSVTSMDVDKLDSEEQNTKQAILNDLLDMSTASAEGGIDDKNLMVKIESNDSVVNTAKNDEHPENNSSDSLFFVTKDSDEESQTEKRPIECANKYHGKLEGLEERNVPLPIEYKEKSPIVENRLSQLMEKSPPKNRHYEKVLSSDLNFAESGENVDKSFKSKSFKNANDTRELLDMLSHLTDKTSSEDTEETAPAVEADKTDIVEPRRLSFAPNRLSIVLSREDLLNNLSMAQAAVQKSRFELDDTDITENINDSPTENSLLKKSVRMSNEVVKTLHFEDESISETSLKSEKKMSPLKKTAFGETSYMRESKAKVIPSYLKDVSDGIKELMLDLVKPMADVLPFEAVGLDKGLKKSASTCSTQVQANLITSSQIDIDSELYSNAESCYNISRIKSPMKTVSMSERSYGAVIDSDYPKPRLNSPSQSLVPGDVLVFDHNNPLNNIHLGPMSYQDAHKYNPNRSNEMISDQMSADKLNTEFEFERVSMQYNVSRLSRAMEGDACSDNAIPITQSNISKAMSIDQSIDAKITELKDIEVNTLIAMKGNKELLQASSSLTLVDDALTNGAFDADIDTRTSSQCSDKPDKRVSSSPVQIIYKIEEQIPEKLQDEATETNHKGKKRNYSPTTRDKYKHIRSVELTPKPNSKMQKMSNSPNVFKAVLDMNHASEHTLNRLAAGQDITEHINIDLHKSKETKKSPRKTKIKKPNTSLTIQQVMTDYPVDAEESILSEVLESDCSSLGPKTPSDIDDCKSLDVISSNASGNRLNDMKGVYSGTTTGTRASSVTSRIDWHPELINELSSKNLVTECESGVNVVAKIDMLPFMGSYECEWEASTADKWTFRLLHARLRLIVRLAHRHDNATRTRVRADTPVTDLAVEVAHQDKKNTVATLCVRFACEALRYMCGRLSRGGAVGAGDVPGLLRRAAAVARVALRWGRAMQDARAHLAYTLDTDGCLALKVANIPLRSVWEVTMRVELVVEDARETPWPRAGELRVARVVSDVRLADAELRRALQPVPRDWGHAPRTIWKVFRYLKHKTRDDEMLLGM